MDAFDDGQGASAARAYGDTGYTLCGLTDGRGQICDRRRNHPGGHIWEMSVPKLPPPHGCLEDRVAALEARIQELARKVDAGPDPRLWAGDPHDGGYRGGRW